MCVETDLETRLLVGMRAVSRDTFFKVMGPLDVHPTSRTESFKDRYHLSEWRLCDGSRRMVGLSATDSWGLLAGRYYVREGMAV